MSGGAVDLYDVADASLDRAAFGDPDIHRLELRRVFAPSWLFLCPATALGSMGGYLTTRMGDTPVVVWLDGAGTPHAFVDLCPRCDRSLSGGGDLAPGCPVHGPVCRVDGYDSELVEVPRVASHRGLLFGCLDADALPFVDWLGGFAPYLDAALDGIGESVEAASTGPLSWGFAGNWKLAVERFCGDVDDGRVVHRATNVAMDGGERSARRGRQIAVGPGAAISSRDPASSARRWSGFSLFPNLSFDAALASLHVWHPVEARRTEVDTYCLVASGAGAEAREAARRASRFAYGPAGLRSQDLAETWRAITATSAGTLARRVRLTVGAGRLVERDRRGGRVGPLRGESNQRAFYGWWQGRMRAANERQALATPLRLRAAG